MGILQKAVKVSDSTNVFPSVENERAWHSVTGNSTYEWAKGNDYENAFPSISKIVNRFMTVAPYAIDKSKERVVVARAVEKLYHPNKQMSSVDFREALAVMYLVHPKTHILVWRLEKGEAKPGGEITADNIAGYTFLEGAVETTIAGKTTYTVNGATYTDDEVITLKGMYPYNLSRGYAVTEAAKRWATIDDYIADYQKGFFKNGAVPSGQFIITAASEQDYKDTVATMQAKHRGAGKNNNVVYTPRPIDPNTGAPGNSKIEWLPFSVDNKSLDLKSIFEQVNKKIDSAYGVPASIRGVGENNNFATAQMDNRNFVENIVNPLTLKIWTRFTHELNRITGGLGYAITYELELPSVSEDEKVQAETNKIHTDTVISLVGAGFSVESAVEAVGAPESFKSLVDGYTPPEKTEDMDVDDGDIADDQPVQPKEGDIVSKGEAANRKDPKATKVLTVEQKTITEQQLYIVAKQFMQTQIDRALRDTKAVGDPTDDDVALFIKEALNVIIPLLVSQGQVEQASQLLLLQESGILTENVTAFKLAEEQIVRYRKYLHNVALSYSADTTEAIRRVLDNANVAGWTSSQIQSELRNITKLDDYRVVRLARTETVRAGGNASLLSMEQIDNQVDATIYKVWTVTSSSPCPTCASLSGKRVGLAEPFVPAGAAVEGDDGGIYVNNFVAADIASIHPNDECTITYEVVR